VPPREFRCGFCDQYVASHHGWITNHHEAFSIRICPFCHRPTYFEQRTQFPGVAYGSPVSYLPANVESIYNEARVCCSVAAYTAAVLSLRKLLMNVAVDVGAPEGQNFIGYVEYLADKGYVPPNGKTWVDHIRKKGNEANHEIAVMNKADAEELVVFSEMLLKFIYEFPKRIPQTPTP
jgi:hypothetical protein